MRRTVLLAAVLAIGCGSGSDDGGASTDDAGDDAADLEASSDGVFDAADADEVEREVESDAAGDDVVDVRDDARSDAPPPPPDAPPPDKDIDTLPWETGASVGYGIARKDTENSRGENVFIAYAGYNVSLTSAEAWATALYRADLRDRGVRWIYAVQGPRDSTYAAKEIGNSRIIASMLPHVTAATKFILVAGHSSGSYVAHELLGQLEGGADPTGATSKRVVYFDLDGGTLYLTHPIIGRLRRAYFVGSFAPESSTASPNDGDMRSVAGTYAPEGATYHRNVASGSGCAPGAVWCVHVTLVISRPHDPTTADPALDYSDFVSRPVAHDWLDAKATESGLVP